MSPIFHNSQDELYRTPYGAQPCGACVTLRLSAPEDAKCTLRLWSELGEEMLGMTKAGYCDGQVLYEVALKLPDMPVILWYAFFVETAGKTLWYGNNPEDLGGVGQICEHLPPSFQITVYAPDYQTPKWLRNGILYQIFPDRFSDGGKPLLDRKPGLVTHKSWDELPNEYAEHQPQDFFGGNLEGVRKNLPYLRDLGVTVLYLNPIFEAKSSHKYDTGDYTKIDPTFGTNEEFERLCAEAKEHGIRILLDGVFSHTGDDSIYFNKYGNYDSLGAYQSEKSLYFNWYRFRHFPEDYACWWNVKTLPELDKDCPEYRNFIFGSENGVAAKWLRAGASGWRLDVADELPDSFIEGLRRRVKDTDPDAAVLGEVWEDASHKVAYGVLRRYALGNSLDSVMNYPLREMLLMFFTGNIASADVKKRLDSLRENYPPQLFYSLMNLIGSHDRARVLTVLSGIECETVPKDEWRTLEPTEKQLETAKKKLVALFAAVCALPGMPALYYGDEVGLTGCNDPYCRKPYPWGREDFELRDKLQSLITLRRERSVLRVGTLTVSAPHPDVLLFLRRIANGRDALCDPAENDSLLFGINRGENPVTIFTEDGRRITLEPLTPYFE